MNRSLYEVRRLMNLFNQHSSCSAHGHGHNHLRSASSSQLKFDNCFEFKSSNLRFGQGVTKELGMDLVNMGAKRVCVVTDKRLSDLPPVISALDSIRENGVEFDLYDSIRVEPTDESFKACAEFAKQGNFDAFVAVGGGSAIDTAKAANLYSSNPDADFLDFVNAPLGKGKPVPPGTLKPLVAIPTTTGTGSETTGVAVFDFKELHAKTGIGSRLMVPTLALVDPDHAQHQPRGVISASGFDVLCHALESYTAIPYDARSAPPANPSMRPAYQGANPISDVWCSVALPMLNENFVRACNNPDDYEARKNMQFAACYAGMGFGTAGVHLCHGMSYPISGMNRDYLHFDYEACGHPLIPHGVSVVVTAPSVFQFTCPANVERHRQAAIWLGASAERLGDSTDADFVGSVLAERLLYFMDALDVPLGLKACGYDSGDIGGLVQGTLPQERVTKLAPTPIDGEILEKLLSNSMEYSF